MAAWCPQPYLGQLGDWVAFSTFGIATATFAVSCSAAILQRATALDTRRDCLNFRQLGWAWRVCQAPPTVLCQAFWKIWPCLGHIAFDRRSKERLSKLLAIVTGRVPCCGARAASILTL